MIAQLVMELTDSTFVAPGLSLGAFAGLLALAAKSYKEARQIDVEGEKNRRIAAEAREAESGKSTAEKVDELTKQVKSLQLKVEQLRVDHEARLLDERGKNFALRQLLKDNGVAFPKELGP
jgi:uncharacterized protein YlxW (UPF0749 family)